MFTECSLFVKLSKSEHFLLPLNIQLENNIFWFSFVPLYEILATHFCDVTFFYFWKVFKTCVIDHAIKNEFKNIFKHVREPMVSWRALPRAFSVFFEKKSESKVLTIRRLSGYSTTSQKCVAKNAKQDSETTALLAAVRCCVTATLPA